MRRENLIEVIVGIVLIMAIREKEIGQQILGLIIGIVLLIGEEAILIKEYRKKVKRDRVISRIERALQKCDK